MNREFCCSNCGLIWFDEKMKANEVTCPECKTTQKDGFGIYACDTFGWFYCSDSVDRALKEQGKSIHYHKEHPLYVKEE